MVLNLVSLNCSPLWMLCEKTLDVLHLGISFHVMVSGHKKEIKYFMYKYIIYTKGFIEFQYEDWSIQCHSEIEDYISKTGNIVNLNAAVVNSF